MIQKLLMLGFAAAGLAGFFGVERTLPSSNIRLADACPPSFELSAENQCLFRSLYQLYSPSGGVGGLRVPIPTPRDGFSPQKIDLGRYLFFDPLLSGDRTLSCAHCHQPDLGFADGLGQGAGVGGMGVGRDRKGGLTLPRSTPSLWNVGFADKLFWDGRAGSLEEQARGPLLSEHEMAISIGELERRLNNNVNYRALFAETFALDAGYITLEHAVESLTAFQSSLISLNSRYDHYAHGDETALSASEIRGHNIFRSFVARCSQCHTPPLFTNNQIAIIGTPEPDGLPIDGGTGDLSNDPALRGGFKVPTLRNIAKSAPYMHSGRFANLHEVVAFYNGGKGHAVSDQDAHRIHWHIMRTANSLKPKELDDLVAFLFSLTDETMTPQVPTLLPSGLNVPSAASRSVAAVINSTIKTEE